MSEPQPKAESAGPMRWRKKPVVIEAMRLDGSQASAFAVRKWVEAHGGHVHDGLVPPGSYPPHEGPHGDGYHCMIYTLEGRMLACPGDYVIKEPFPTGDRTFYPCKPDIFEATYEPAGWEASDV